MDKTTQQNIEISLFFNLIAYIDLDMRSYAGLTVEELLVKLECDFHSMGQEGPAVLSVAKQALKLHPEWGEARFLDQSATNATPNVKDDLTQGCTFRDAQGNYYVAFRGTGEGRWPDNAKGIVQTSEMQKASCEYFDSVIEKLRLEEAKKNGAHIYVTGHSKGGNEAQYCMMASKYQEMIDECYSFDGQGFSAKAIEEFKAFYGDEYENKLNRMYSICGENDYVHDLGIVIIPQENTYFVETFSSGFEAWHAPEYILGFQDESGNWYYSDLSWTRENGKIVHGEQGPVGEIARKISENLMSMDVADIEPIGTTVMVLVDYFTSPNKKDWKIIGEIKYDPKEIVPFLTKGLPTVVESLADWAMDKYGPWGGVGIYAGTAIMVTAVPMIAGALVVTAVKNLPEILFAVCVKKLADRFGITEKISNILEKIKISFDSVKGKVSDWIYRQSYTYNYLQSHDTIRVNTGLLKDYANRLNNINTRLGNLDQRLNGLYLKVGLLDLWKLLSADLMTSESKRLKKCKDYLNNTAVDFERVEMILIQQ